MEAVQNDANSNPIPRTLGRYEVVGVLGRGGMATVYLARHVGEAGFQRLLAIKVLHPHLAHEREFVTMLLDEARIAARLHHPNLVPIVDLGSEGVLHYVVMEYVEGCTVSSLLAKHKNQRPPRLIVPIVLDALTGLHAAHTLTDENGQPMNLVHRDVSPQNILVGVDAIARVTDFGIARAEARINSTRPGQMKGKLAFMSPEQVRDSSHIDARSDVFAMGVLLWSALTARRLFRGSSDAATLGNVLSMPIPVPSSVGLKPPAVFDDICMRALERDPEKRFSSALEMEEALREVAIANGFLGSRREIAEWVHTAFDDELTERRNAIRSAISHVSARRQAMESVSGFRVIPTVGSLTPPGAQTPPSLTSTSLGQALPVGPAPAAPHGSKVPMIAASAALLLSAVLGGWVLHGPGVPAARPSAPSAVSASPEATQAQTQAPGPAAPPAPSAAPPAASAAAEKPSDSARPAPDKTPTKARRVVVRRYVRHVPKRAAPAKTAEAPAPAPAKKARAWDNDSPLPPE